MKQMKIPQSCTKNGRQRIIARSFSASRLRAAFAFAFADKWVNKLESGMLKLSSSALELPGLSPNSHPSLLRLLRCIPEELNVVKIRRAKQTLCCAATTATTTFLKSNGLFALRSRSAADQKVWSGPGVSPTHSAPPPVTNAAYGLQLQSAVCQFHKLYYVEMLEIFFLFFAKKLPRKCSCRE